MPMRDLWLCFLAVLGQWVALMSGGIIIVLLALWERYKGYPIPRKFYLMIFAFFIPFAFFLAWRDQSRRAEELEEKVLFVRPYFSVQKSEIVKVQNEADSVPKASVDVITIQLLNTNDHPATQVRGHILLIDNELKEEPFEMTVIRKANDVAHNQPFFVYSKPLGIPQESPPRFVFCELTYRDASVPGGTDLH